MIGGPIGVDSILCSNLYLQDLALANWGDVKGMRYVALYLAELASS